jgi:YVTN family beta-propeller protein
MAWAAISRNRPDSSGLGNRVVVLGRGGDLICSVPVGRRPWNPALIADGRKLYAANGVSNDVSVIDTASLKVIAAIHAGEGLWGAATASSK